MFDANEDPFVAGAYAAAAAFLDRLAGPLLGPELLVQLQQRQRHNGTSWIDLA